MGWLRDLIYGPELGERAAVIVDEKPLREIPLTIEGQIEAAIAARGSAFTLADAMHMPAVIRSVQLICTVIAQFRPVAYRNGEPIAEQPPLLTRPSPLGTPNEFWYQTIYSQLALGGSAGTGGDAYWLIVDRDDEGNARHAIVLDPAEVVIRWDDRRFLPVYSWRGVTFRPGGDLVHLAIGRPPGELHGRSPLIAGLEQLAVIAAAEEYALGFFTTSGVPSVTINVPGKIGEGPARALKAQWMAAHSGPPSPAVLSEGMTADYPPVDAQRAQLLEARQHGTTVAATLLGIPAPLLHVTTSGATITYTNAGGALDEFVRATGQPVYLAPLEGQLSLLVPRTQSVRFDTGELDRLDLAGRMSVYATAIGAGVMSPAEARINEGWPASSPIESVPEFAAVPAVPALTWEVPARV